MLIERLHRSGYRLNPEPPRRLSLLQRLLAFLAHAWSGLMSGPNRWA